MLRIGFLAATLILGGCAETAPDYRHATGPGYGYPYIRPNYFFGFGGAHAFRERGEHERHQGHAGHEGHQEAGKR